MPEPSQRSPWWRPDRHADRRPFLLARGVVQAALRRWFETEGFIEVETSALQLSPGNEAHLHAFRTEVIDPAGRASPLYLHTSPEFACKKLLAAGEERIFTFAQVYRNRERGALHHPSFTMLEWYRAGEPYERVMDDCAQLMRIAAQAAGTSTLRHRDREADPFGVPERLTVAQAFASYAAIDLLATLTSEGGDRGALARAATEAGIKIAMDDSWSDIFSRVSVEKVEPHLGNGLATLLTEYPSVEAALARRTEADPRVAERFELFACGVELVNAFGELTDPEEQRQRFEAEMDKKQRLYGERYPIDQDFLSALAHMPPASGAALGFDRLIMLVTGARHIDQVLWTPLPEPT